MMTNYCEDHYLALQVRNSAAKDPLTQSYIGHTNEARDLQRRCIVPADRRVTDIEQVPRSLFRTNAIAKNDLRRIADRARGLDCESALTVLREEMPFVAEEAVTAAESKTTVQLIVKFLWALRCERPSVDLSRQFDVRPAGTGRVNGHARDAVALISGGTQIAKGSSHPFVYLLCHGAQRVWTALADDPEDDPEAILAAIGRILQRLAPMQAAYLNAARQEYLAPQWRPVSHELHELLVPEPAQSPQVPLLLALIAQDAPSPPANAKRMADTYEGVPQSLPDALTRLLEDDEIPVLDRALECLRADEAALAVLSPAQEAAEAAYWGKVADVFEAEYEGLEIPRNAQGMPVLWFSKDTSTKHILQLGSNAHARGVLVCERGARHRAQCRFQELGRGEYWRVIVVWHIHFATKGDRDGFHRLPIDFSGRKHSGMAPTLAAHRTHGHPLFRQTGPRPAIFEAKHIEEIASDNCVVQSRFTNYFVGSRHICSILQSIDNSNAACCTVLERLANAGALPIGPRALQKIKQNTVLLDQDTLQELWWNRVDPWEM